MRRWAGLWLALVACSPPPDERPAGSDAIALLSREAPGGFETADQPRTLTFPLDHGAHPGFQSEWWYVTGNLRGEERDFGFQLTLFRFALAPGRLDEGWQTRQIWLGQLAVSDIARARFLDAERIARQAFGLAGAASDRLSVWVEDWRIDAAGPDLQSIRLQAGDRRIGLDLELSAQRPIILHGQRGLSRKSAQPGNASYYYSVPRLAAAGRLRIDDREFTVEGSAWFDREWSTSALEDEQSGWDWFAIQLDDGYDLMLYRLRRADGSMHPFSAGTLIAPDGTTRTLSAEVIQAEALDFWRSPETGIRYPVRWQLAVPGLSAEITARFEAQEHSGRFDYWEGAVAVQGRHRDRPVSGTGYLEMTGYE